MSHLPFPPEQAPVPFCPSEARALGPAGRHHGVGYVLAASANPGRKH